MTLDSVATLVVQQFTGLIYRLLIDRNVSRVSVTVIIFECFERTVHKFYMIKVVLYNFNCIYSWKSTNVLQVQLYIFDSRSCADCRYYKVIHLDKRQLLFPV